MQRDLNALRDAAHEFAAQHVAELARNVNEWHDTAILPAQCRMRELATLCEALDRPHSLQLAESFVNRACRDAAALASAPAAEKKAGSDARLIDLLAACRDAFPIPDAGHPLEPQWMEAMQSPSNVPAYVQACLSHPQAQVVAQPDGRLHADGYFTWNKGKRPAYIADRGLPCDFYLAPPAARAEPLPSLARWSQHG